MSYLNRRTGKNFSAGRDKTKRLIEARLKDGFTVEDIKLVIDKKSKQWKGTEMDLYLRPDTLLGNKFEGYLNEKDNVQQSYSKLSYGRQRRVEIIPKWMEEQSAPHKPSEENQGEMDKPKVLQSELEERVELSEHPKQEPLVEESEQPPSEKLSITEWFGIGKEARQ